ncbi:hypothetical protein EVG20_g4943 [Dentipellis fragilis]|uniref:Ribosome biogenesis protein NSA1 n=1 Tax=Dentipellis fragilis TaxID=205917 RepID=A0A4Y9YUP1_9AGAM|nr:hypothetical protein EVG20_g4943 [Dentipellis fragilis]
MPRFLAGDELGNIKSLKYIAAEKPGETKAEVSTIYDGSEGGKEKAIQALSVSADGAMISAARADGTAGIYRLKEDSLEIVHDWKEPRLKAGQRYVGLAMSSRGVYSCTSNGALRLTTLGEDGDASSSTLHTAVLPMHLADWQLSTDEKTFAYGGDEVELSVWDTEKAFTAKRAEATSEVKKRKRAEDLLPGEVWRAKNVANDTLNLRQPVNNTCLAYLSASGSHSRIAVGTQLGNVRQYDTRAARRPVVDWKNVAKVGGVRAIEKGFHEHELFIADQGCNLHALDLRTGRVMYGYKGLSGAVTSIAASPTVLASSALDRYLRVHSRYPPPEDPNDQQEQKGEVLEKIFVKSIPTVIIWDKSQEHSKQKDVEGEGEEESDDEDVWEGMQNVDDDSEEDVPIKRRSKKAHKAT